MTNECIKTTNFKAPWLVPKSYLGEWKSQRTQGPLVEGRTWKKNLRNIVYLLFQVAERRQLSRLNWTACQGFQKEFVCGFPLCFQNGKSQGCMSEFTSWMLCPCRQMPKDEASQYVLVKLLKTHSDGIQGPLPPPPPLAGSPYCLSSSCLTYAFHLSSDNGALQEKQNGDGGTSCRSKSWEVISRECRSN